METRHLILLLMPLLLQLLGLSFAVLTDRYLQTKHRRDLLLITGLVLCLVVQNILGNELTQGSRIFARTVNAIAGYSIYQTVTAGTLEGSTAIWNYILTILAPACYALGAFFLLIRRRRAKS